MPWAPEPKEKPPEGKAAQIATTWENQVVFLPDTNHNGKPTPCIVGRMYLFGNQGPEPVAGPGKVEIQLLRNDQTGPDGEAKVLEIWPLPDNLLQQMCSKDMIGWGYSLALPWATYHPGLKNLTVTVAFTPKDGFPIYSRSKLNLRQQEKGFAIQNSVDTPGAPRPNAMPGGVNPNMPAPPNPYANMQQNPRAAPNYSPAPAAYPGYQPPPAGNQVPASNNPAFKTPIPMNGNVPPQQFVP